MNRNALGNIGMGVLALWLGAYLGLEEGVHAGLARRFGTRVAGQVKQSFVSKGRSYVDVQFQHGPDEAVTANVGVSQRVYDRYGKEWTPAALHYFRPLKEWPVIEGDDSWPGVQAVRAIIITVVGVSLVFVGWNQLVQSVSQR